MTFKPSKEHYLYLHGHRPAKKPSRTYKTWVSMHHRCADTSNKNYGGRGVTVCERWRIFTNFLDDMGERPEGATIDRIDADGNYCPENCRWATTREQALNKRTSVKTAINGEIYNLVEVADLYGIPRTTIYRRYHQGLRGEELISKANRNAKRTGELCPSSKLTREDVVVIKKLLAEGEKTNRVAKMFSVSQPTISDINRGATWKDV